MSTTTALKGLAFVDTDGTVRFSNAIATDKRLVAMLHDKEWINSSCQRRLSTILLSETRLTVLVTPSAEGNLFLFFDGQSDTLTRFFLSVDFAFDILDQMLRDPYDALIVVDAQGKLVYMASPHESYFDLHEGEATGQPIRDVIKTAGLGRVARTGIAEIGQPVTYNKGQRVVSRFPVRRGDRVVGAFGRVMFKNSEDAATLANRVNALEGEVASYKRDLNISRKGAEALDAIIGKSAAIETVRDQIRRIAPLDIPVLIQGESGTGKELVAKAIHMMSTRSKERLVTVNAAALPLSLVESELFGYDSGAFTGANKSGKAGKFEQANNGTLFLDEIGEMPLEVQSKLLRVLQDGIVERVGGDKSREINFRLCTATNRELEHDIKDGKFRLDLFFRITPVTIKVPSLEERVEDIPLLVEHFLKKLAEQHGKFVPRVDDSAIEYLSNREWLGNIRELKHLIERVLIFFEGKLLTAADFEESASQSTSPTQRSSVLKSARPLRDAVAALESELIDDAISRFNGNKKMAAEYLGVSRSYLYKKMSEFGNN